MNILKKFKRIEQSVKSNVTINDGIDGLPFQDDDSWVDDGIDGLSFSSSTECLTSKPNQKIKKMGEKLWGIFRA